MLALYQVQAVSSISWHLNFFCPFCDVEYVDDTPTQVQRSVKRPAIDIIQQGVTIIGAFRNLVCILQWNQHFSIDHNLTSEFQNCKIQKLACRETFQLYNSIKFIGRNASQPKIQLSGHLWGRLILCSGVWDLWINFFVQNVSRNCLICKGWNLNTRTCGKL